MEMGVTRLQEGFAQPIGVLGRLNAPSGLVHLSVMAAPCFPPWFNMLVASLTTFLSIQDFSTTATYVAREIDRAQLLEQGAS